MPAQPYPSRCMPSRPSEPASLTMPRSMSPRSYQSATNGFTRWSTNSRTVAWMSRSSERQQVVDLQQVQGGDAGHLRSIPATCWAAFSMSSSPSSTCWAAVPNGTKEFRLDTRRIGPAKPLLDQSGDDALADPAIMPGLVDHQHPAGQLSLDQDVLDRQRREPAQVADPGGDALVAESLGHPQAHRDPVAEADHGQVGGRGPWLRARPIGTCSPSSTVNQPSSPGACRSREW